MRLPAPARLARIPALVLALGAPPCQETNPAFDRDDTGTAGSESTGPGSTSTAGTMTLTGVDDSTGPALTTAEPGTSTSDPDPSTGDPGSDGSSSSGGDPTPAAYPPCSLGDDPVCPRPYDQCYDFLAPEFTVCSQTCAGDDDCPQPDGGTAAAVCAGPNDDQCVLDCAGGAQCPAGMSCEMVGGGNARRCVWPA